MIKDFSSTSDTANPGLRERLLHIQAESGFTQLQLAAYLNIGQSAVCKYLQGRIPPSAVLFKFARLGQTTMEWILSGQKSYFYESGSQGVSESVQNYGAAADTDIAWARRLARLPARKKRLALELIEMLEDQKE